MKEDNKGKKPGREAGSSRGRSKSRSSRKGERVALFVDGINLWYAQQKVRSELGRYRSTLGDLETSVYPDGLGRPKDYRVQTVLCAAGTLRSPASP